LNCYLSLNFRFFSGIQKSHNLLVLNLFNFWMVSKEIFVHSEVIRIVLLVHLKHSLRLAWARQKRARRYVDFLFSLIQAQQLGAFGSLALLACCLLLVEPQIVFKLCELLYKLLI